MLFRLKIGEILFQTKIPITIVIFFLLIFIGFTSFKRLVYIRNINFKLIKNNKYIKSDVVRLFFIFYSSLFMSLCVLIYVAIAQSSIFLMNNLIFYFGCISIFMFITRVLFISSKLKINIFNFFLIDTFSRILMLLNIIFFIVDRSFKLNGLFFK